MRIRVGGEIGILEDMSLTQRELALSASFKKPTPDALQAELDVIAWQSDGVFGYKMSKQTYRERDYVYFELTSRLCTGGHPSFGWAAVFVDGTLQGDVLPQHFGTLRTFDTVEEVRDLVAGEMARQRACGGPVPHASPR